MNIRQDPSPTKIVFNYANQIPQHSQQVIQTNTYSPRIIQSGFVLG